MTTTSEFEQLLESNISQLNMTVGDIIPAKVIDIKNDFVITNAGLKSEGVIPKSQFINSNGELEVAIGDIVEVTLDLIEDGSKVASNISKLLEPLIISSSLKLAD